MNVHDAKRIPLHELLARLGSAPVKQVRGELWYASPFRSETTPSFKLNPERTLWYDFGEGRGGNVLDFALRYFGVTTISEALCELDALYPGGQAVSLSIPPRVPGRVPEPAMLPPDAIVQPLQHRALRNYLAGRGIAAELAQSFVEEIHYTRDGKRYFALAFRNNHGGYELRNPYFKGTMGPKAITTIASLVPSAPLAVFEGSLDLLSAITCDMLTKPLPPILVLNSTALREQALTAIRERHPAAVDLYLDHDQSGRELTQYFHQQLTAAGIAVTDRSNRYDGFKDVNDSLIAQPSRVVRRSSVMESP